MIAYADGVRQAARHPVETSLRPLLQWLRTWSDLEGAVADFWTPRPPRS